MTNPTENPDRLDRIEAILGTLANNQADDRERLSRIEQLIESNARAIAANSEAIAANSTEIRTSITDMVSMITAQADQAEIDRAEFRAEFQQLLETLNQRFTSNGH